MEKNLKFKSPRPRYLPDGWQADAKRGRQNSKLMILCALGAVLGILIFITATSNAEYKIYLKNGRTISGIEEIKHENGNVKIFKEGILLDMPKANILKIEEYKPAFVEKPQEEGGAESGEKPAGSQTPDYLKFDKEAFSNEQKAKEEAENARLEKLQETKEQKQSIDNKVNSLKTLQDKSSSLGYQINRQMTIGKLRKVRQLREEKKQVDAQIESLKKEKEPLIEHSEELEEEIDNLER